MLLSAASFDGAELIGRREGIGEIAGSRLMNDDLARTRPEVEADWPVPELDAEPDGPCELDEDEWPVVKFPESGKTFSTFNAISSVSDKRCEADFKCARTDFDDIMILPHKRHLKSNK